MSHVAFLLRYYLFQDNTQNLFYVAHPKKEVFEIWPKRKRLFLTRMHLKL